MSFLEVLLLSILAVIYLTCIFTVAVGRKNSIGAAKQPIGTHDASRPG